MDDLKLDRLEKRLQKTYGEGWLFKDDVAELLSFARKARRIVKMVDSLPDGTITLPAPAATVGLDALREAVSDFRKATIEFAKGMGPDDHKRMMEAQERIFDAALSKREGEQR